MYLARKKLRQGKKKTKTATQRLNCSSISRPLGELYIYILNNRIILYVLFMFEVEKSGLQKEGISATFFCQ